MLDEGLKFSLFNFDIALKEFRSFVQSFVCLLVYIFACIIVVVFVLSFNLVGLTRYILCLFFTSLNFLQALIITLMASSLIDIHHFIAPFSPQL